MQAFAHSGRTDGSGGHRDNKNKSGLGSYHYHCGGYPPHLHNNGVCPYDTSVYEDPSSIVKTNGVSKNAVAIKEEPKIGIIGTDIRTFINSNEIPTFLYNGEPNSTVVIIEDLKNYGFDKIWDNENRTLTLTKNTQKKATPINMEYYHGLKQGQYLFDLLESDIKVLLKNSSGSEAIESKKVYFINGYTAISTDELKNFGTFKWDNESREISILIE